MTWLLFGAVGLVPLRGGLWTEAVPLELLVEGGGEEAQPRRGPPLIAARRFQRGQDQAALVGPHARTQVGRPIVFQAHLTRSAMPRRDRRGTRPGPGVPRPGRHPPDGH